VIDLHDLKGRVRKGDEVRLSHDEGVQLIAELEASRLILGVSPEGKEPSLGAQRDMLAHLLKMLSQDVGTSRDAELVAGVVIQEMAALRTRRRW